MIEEPDRLRLRTIVLPRRQLILHVQKCCRKDQEARQQDPHKEFDKYPLYNLRDVNIRGGASIRIEDRLTGILSKAKSIAVYFENCGDVG